MIIWKFNIILFIF